MERRDDIVNKEDLKSNEEEKKEIKVRVGRQSQGLFRVIKEF